MNYKNELLILVFMLFSNVAMAAMDWKIIPNESSLGFTGTQNDAPASGSFKKFNGEISFDPAHFDTSKVHIVVGTNSITSSYSDMTTTLMTPDWFNVKIFPQAVFQASHFTKVADNKYQADGTLTIRNKTEPVVLTFTLQKLAKDKMRAKGSTTLKRTLFGVGQGEWADTSAVKDEVQVNFVVTASKKR